MKRFKGTPGPWRVADIDNCYKDVIEDANGDYVALAQARYRDKAEADARLIAAAPELLEALDRLVDLIDSEGEGLEGGMPTPQQWYEARNKAEAAIIKALEE